MGCSGCSTSKNGTPGGCQNNGHCSSGGCNRMNTFDWLSDLEAPDISDFQAVEVSFKNGSRKNFYYNSVSSRTETGDMVVVEAGSGYDVGMISLSGELVKMQMKKKRVNEDTILPKVIRKAHERDLERYNEARSNEQKVMVRARAIARSLNLEMKIGDVEYQGDKRKVTFYYTADGRVDFRELIRHYAREFRVKIEMRQIGARQESARIGGLGSCGRELCCSTWLTDFKSVSTTAARYQNLAINQSKLSGQCGRLKCCLNYELDTYMDALKEFPENADRLLTTEGTAQLIKIDIFKGIMFYGYREASFPKTYALHRNRVKEILAMNKKGEKPEILLDIDLLEENKDLGFEDVTGVIELPPEKKKSGKKRSRNNRNRRNYKHNKNKGSDQSGKPQSSGENKSSEKSKNPDPQKKKSGGNKKKYYRNKKKKE